MKLLAISLLMLSSIAFSSNAFANESLVGDGVVEVPANHSLQKVRGMVGLINGFSCTLFMVGPRHAMTASHCFGGPYEIGLISATNPGDSRIVFPGYGYFKIKSFLKKDIKYSGAKSAKYFSNDYAVLELESVNGSKFPPYFEMKESFGNTETVFMPEQKWDYENKVNREIYTFNASECLTKDIRIKKQTFKFLGTYSFLISDCKIKEGMSGGPLLVETDGKIYANGVNIASNGEGDEGSETYSVQFTSDMIKEVKTWISNH